MKTESIPVVAIDGPSGSGKGTVSMHLATRLGYHLLDSGALYRLVGLAARRVGVDMQDAEALSQLVGQLDVRFESMANPPQRTLLAGKDVTELLRTEEASQDASMVARIPEVRSGLLKRQREFRVSPGLVADGRDMGTRIFPDASVKIFLTASPEVRAQRRYRQLKDKVAGVSLSLTLEGIRERDRKDLERIASPLRPADDAVILDTTDMGLEQVFSTVWQEIQANGLGHF